MNKKGIDQDLFEKFISEALQDNKVCKPLKRLHSIVDKHNDLVRKEILDCHLQNKLFQKRYVLETLNSIPYGFTKDMYDAQMNKY